MKFQKDPDTKGSFLFINKRNRGGFEKMKFSEYLINEKFLTGDNLRARFGRSDDPIAYINVHVNPDHSEVLSIIDDFKQTSPNVYRNADVKDFVRGFFDKKGNLYVWYGAFFHDNVERFLQKQPGTANLEKNERFRFAWLKGDKHLTLEGEHDAGYFNREGAFEDEQERIDLLERLWKAFPMTKTESGDKPNVNTNASSDAWVPDMEVDDEDGKSSDANKSTSKEKTSEKPKRITNPKDLAKIGDTIIFSNKAPDNRKGKQVKILAIIKHGGDFHYVFKALRNDQYQYTAEKLNTMLKSDNYIDGKFNIKQANEPFGSNDVNGDHIEKIIPDPERLKKLGNNLYEPRNVVSRGYTNPDRMELKENKKGLTQ